MRSSRPCKSANLAFPHLTVNVGSTVGFFRDKCESDAMLLREVKPGCNVDKKKTPPFMVGTFKFKE